jgi:hypothetical protein
MTVSSLSLCQHTSSYPHSDRLEIFVYYLIFSNITFSQRVYIFKISSKGQSSQEKRRRAPNAEGKCSSDEKCLYFDGGWFSRKRCEPSKTAAKRISWFENGVYV